MESLRRNRLSQLLDGLGVRALLLAAGVGYFTFLWGLSVPSLLAGASLGILLMMTRSSFRRRTVVKREQSLRARIGAEMLLDDLLLADAESANRRAIELLLTRFPLEVIRVTGDGAIVRQGDETLLIQLLRMPPDAELSYADGLNACRIALREHADRIVLCVMGKSTAKAEARCDTLRLPVRIIRRETLLTLAGRACPATDEQLVALGKRRRMPRGSVTRLIFRPDKARRYLGYGAAMVVLFVLTTSRLYAVPGMVCLTMAAISGANGGRDGGL